MGKIIPGMKIFPLYFSLFYGKSMQQNSGIDMYIR